MELPLKNGPALPLLEQLGACKDALDWVGDRDLRTALAECDRVDWLAWIAYELLDMDWLVYTAKNAGRRDKLMGQLFKRGNRHVNAIPIKGNADNFIAQTEAIWNCYNALMSAAWKRYGLEKYRAKLSTLIID